MKLTEVTNKSKCCCSCKHNKRVLYEDRVFHCHCDKDGHHIGYVANFEQVCEEWEGGNNG